MVHVLPSLVDTTIYLPTSGLAFLRRHVQLLNIIARNLIRSRLSEMDDGKDALSRIVIMNSRQSLLHIPDLSLSSRCQSLGVRALASE